LYDIIDDIIDHIAKAVKYRGKNPSLAEGRLLGILVPFPEL
jgi:hypothetical protein